jgi:thiaminase (transcriptional activator TenA)
VSATAAPASLCERLRQACAPLWEALHEHPFVEGLTDATLPPETFRFYIEQNLQYLPEYARAMALAAGRANDVETMRIFAADLVNIVETEIPENRDLLARVLDLGPADRGGSDGMAPTNLAYTGFLVATAATARPVEVMAAIVPCAWSYGEIAARRADRIVEHPVYSEWIRFFGSRDYSAVVERMQADFEVLAARDDVPFGRLSELFTTGVRLERAFWDMAYTLDHWPDVRSRYDAA